MVMLVANEVTNDSRVRKEAAALVETGAHVTVLGISTGEQSREMLDGAMIVRVAIPFTMREERKFRRTKPGLAATVRGLHVRRAMWPGASGCRPG